MQYEKYNDHLRLEEKSLKLAHKMIKDLYEKK
jgi:hypothetical protein